MLITIDYHSGVPIYRQIVDQIRSQILSQVVEPGRQVPAVRQLATELKVNPMTVSKAYSYLEMEGMLQRRRGVGLFIASMEQNDRKLKQKEELREQIRAMAAQARLYGLDKAELLDMVGEVYDAGPGKHKEHEHE